MTRRNKPKTPEQIAAEKLAKRQRDFEAASLPDNADLTTSDDIEVRREGQKNVLTARRADVFDLLKPGMAPGAYDAARRLEKEILLSRREGDAAQSMGRVDSKSSEREFAYLIAADNVRKVQAAMGSRDWWLITELIVPVPSRPAWRDTVAYITAETHSHAQGAAVRAACVNLRDAYDRISRKAA